jgi:hypothetical protein
MWLFTRYGFYSIASATSASKPNGPTGPSDVMIRARCRAHIESLRKRFPELSEYKIREWPNRDYRFRLIIDKETWVRVIAELAREQTWSNFKNEVADFQSKDHDYIHALHDVWSIMKNLQQTLPANETRPSISAFEDPPATGTWDGITMFETPTEEGTRLRQDLADCGRDYHWSKLLDILSGCPELVNSSRPGGDSWYAPLHQAAHGGASLDVVTALLRLGAWRTLRNSEGKRPVDIARDKGHTNLQQILEPVYVQYVPLAVLGRIQESFREVIRERADRLIHEHGLRLPDLEPLLEFPLRKFWFAVPGMHGGFSYWLAYDGENAKLITESWSRVVGGSGQRHEIAASGCKLVDEGFV